MVTMNTMSVADELAEVHERLRQLVVVATYAEVYLGAGEHELLVASMLEADQLADVPFRDDVEDVLTGAGDREWPLRMIAGEPTSAPTATQLMPAVYLRTRNVLVTRYLRQLPERKIAPSKVDARGIYPVARWPVGATWETFVELMVADQVWTQVALREWRVAMEQLVRQLPSELSSAQYLSASSEPSNTPADMSRWQGAMEAMADAMDEGWVPESYPWDEPRQTPRAVDPKKEPLREYLRPLFVGGVGTKTIVKKVAIDPLLQEHLNTAGVDTSDEEAVEREIDSARRYIKNPARSVA